MLPLNGLAAWKQLKDAYGPAEQICSLLLQLESLPRAERPDAEPYFSLWSALCHQGDVYEASYAAVPHLVRIAGANHSSSEAFGVLHLAAAIESARLCGRGRPVPQALRDDYDRAIEQIPLVVTELLKLHRSAIDARMAMIAIAAAMGHGELADAVADLDVS